MALGISFAKLDTIWNDSSNYNLESYLAGTLKKWTSNPLLQRFTNDTIAFHGISGHSSPPYLTQQVCSACCVWQLKAFLTVTTVGKNTYFPLLILFTFLSVLPTVLTTPVFALPMREIILVILLSTWYSFGTFKGQSFAEPGLFLSLRTCLRASRLPCAEITHAGIEAQKVAFNPGFVRVRNPSHRTITSCCGP